MEWNTARDRNVGNVRSRSVNLVNPIFPRFHDPRSDIHHSQLLPPKPGPSTQIHTSNPRILLKLHTIEPFLRIIQPPRLIRTHPLRLLEPSRPLTLPDHIPPALIDLQTQATAGVPGDMAMDEPQTRIVGFEGDDDVAVCGEDDVAARWVFVVEDVWVELVGGVPAAVVLLS